MNWNKLDKIIIYLLSVGAIVSVLMIGFCLGAGYYIESIGFLLNLFASIAIVRAIRANY